ncbi:hypothetical protein ACFWBS_42640 [Streptomyces mirabilis]|uniref:hypothetical protein n=1 Tax=Streptomyces TaxID=1883 RepID=UPI000BE26407|nr:hypothetical protein [Streptomyces sp. OK228]
MREELAGLLITVGDNPERLDGEASFAAQCEELAQLGNAELFRTCARFTDASSQEEGGEAGVLQATRVTLGLLACRIGQLSEQIRDVDARLARLVKCHAPQLLDVVGIGPDTALVCS